MTGDERAYAQIKSSILDVLNNESDRAVKFSLTKRGYMHILRMNQLNCCCFSLEHQIESDMLMLITENMPPRLIKVAGNTRPSF